MKFEIEVIENDDIHIILKDEENTQVYNAKLDNIWQISQLTKFLEEILNITYDKFNKEWDNIYVLRWNWHKEEWHIYDIFQEQIEWKNNF